MQKNGTNVSGELPEVTHTLRNSVHFRIIQKGFFQSTQKELTIKSFES